MILSKPQAGGGAQVDRVDYGLQIPDKSISRIAPSLAWGLSVPTPNAANQAQSWVDAGSVRINEWTSAGHVQFSSDFVELYNGSFQPASIGGCYLSDDPSTRQDQYRIPDLSFIAGLGFAVFEADGAAASADATQLNFKLDRFTEWVVLSDAGLNAIDEIQFQAQPEDITFGRVPDGGVSIQPLGLPTLGFSNGLAPTTSSVVTNLIPLRASWHYDETSTALAANWMSPAYTEPASWKTGALPFGLEPDLTAVTQDISARIWALLFPPRTGLTISAKPSTSPTSPPG